AEQLAKGKTAAPSVKDKSQTKSPGKGDKGKKGPEPAAVRKDTKLKLRGEEEDTSKCIDDEPDDGPHHYILVVGFHHPQLLVVLAELGVYVSNVIKITSESYESLLIHEESMSILQADSKLVPEVPEVQKLNKEKEAKSLKMFWKYLVPVLKNNKFDSQLPDTAHLHYVVKKSVLPQEWNSNAMMVFATEEDKAPLSEGISKPRADGLDQSIVNYMMSNVLSLAISEEERKFQDGFDPVKAEPQMLRLLPVARFLTVPQPSTENKKRLARIQELIHFCTDESISWSELERVFNQFGFESMKLTEVGEDGELMKAGSKFDDSRCMPWDDPVGFAKKKTNFTLKNIKKNKVYFDNSEKGSEASLMKGEDSWYRDNAPFLNGRLPTALGKNCPTIQYEAHSSSALTGHGTFAKINRQTKRTNTKQTVQDRRTRTNTGEDSWYRDNAPFLNGRLPTALGKNCPTIQYKAHSSSALTEEQDRLKEEESAKLLKKETPEPSITPVPDNVDSVPPEKLPPFKGYNMGNTLIQVSGMVQSLFPSHGGQIQVECINYVQEMKKQMKRISMFGSFSAVLASGINLSFSNYGPSGEGNEDPDLVSMLNIPSACTTSLVPPTTNPPAATPVKKAKSHKAKSPRAKSPRAKSRRLKYLQGRGTTSSPPTTAETPRNEEPKVEIEPSLSEVNAEPVPELPDFQSLNVSCPNGLLVNFFSEQSLDVRDLVGGLPESPAGTWVATAPSGLRVATKGEEKIQIKHALAYKAADPVNEVAMITREDKVLTAIGNDDYVAVEHADGTRITTFNQDVEIPGSMDHDETAKRPFNPTPSHAGGSDKTTQSAAEYPDRASRSKLDPMSSRLEGMHSEGGDVNPYHSLKVDLSFKEGDLPNQKVCRRRFQCNAMGSQIYAVGGRGERGILFSAECYNPTEDKWRYIKALPSPLSSHAGTVHQNELYVCGGSSGEVFSGSVFRYTPELDEWTTLPPLRHPRGFHNMTSVGDKIYVMGGVLLTSADGQRRAYSDVKVTECYCPLSDQWTELSPLPVGHSQHGAAALGNKIYIMGGFSWEEERFLNTVHVYSCETDTWSTGPELPRPLVGLSSGTLTLPHYHSK
ncbi:UNVERIFIED_CONTAM: hypothetical protein FKN15_065255, partial [Acipenser sinensis]